MNFLTNNQLDGIDPAKEQELINAEEEALKSEAMEKLKARFGHSTTKQSWLSRNYGNKRTAHLSSFLFNVISALAGLYGARILFQMVPVPIPYLDWVLAIGFMFVMEKYKRKFSDKFWDIYWSTRRIVWSYALANFGLFLVSLSLSIFGVYFAAKDFSPEAKYIGGGDNLEVVALQDQYSQVEGKLNDLLEDKSSYNSQGLFYHKLMGARTALENQLADIQTTLKDKHGVISLQNEDILEDWKLRNAFRGKFSIVITFLSELLFELCMAFCSYYDYRYCRALIASSETKGRKSGKVATLAA